MGEGLAEQSGISLGTLIGSLHRLRELLKPVMSRLIEEYRSASVKHADETGWRNNGNNGYAWLFSTPDTAIFRLRKTRGGQIALEMFGNKRLPGVLVVDRYNGYNKAPCDIQYCQAHLLREIQDLGKELPETKEVQEFVGTAAELIAQTMRLRTAITEDKEYLEAATENHLWRYLRNRHLEGFKFRRQQPIGKYIVDFVNFEKKVIIELDGGQHSFQEEKDKIRDEWLEKEGFKVLRFWDNEVLGNTEGVLKVIREKLNPSS